MIQTGKTLFKNTVGSFPLLDIKIYLLKTIVVRKYELT